MTRLKAEHTIAFVPKLAVDETIFRRRALQFGSCREAIAAFARAAGAKPGDTVLCPAYVGWSPREGSGVVDPLASLGIRVNFYRTSADLGVDLADLSWRLKDRPAGAIIIHFFGHVDAHYREAVRLIHEAGAWCLEDEAHALLTDLVAGSSGRLGDASVLSLHKMLPVRGGGALLIDPAMKTVLDKIDAPDVSAQMLWDHDLAAIAKQRRRNAADLARMLRPLSGRVDSLWSFLRDDEVLQTYPVTLRDVSRDRVYDLMNASGYGVVSLYHTLVEGIQLADYPLSHALSRSILNLPIHQDLRTQHLEDLIARLTTVLDEVGNEPHN